MSVRIVDCEEEHVSALQAFFGRVYRPDYALRDPALLRWQFQQTPGGDPDRWHIKLALVDGDVAGCLGYIPLEISLPDRRVPGAWVVNWMVDPDRRRLGLGPLLMREVVGRFEVTLNVGPNPDARELLTRMGWWTYGELPRHVAVLDVEAAAALTETGQLTWSEKALDAARTAHRAPSHRVVPVDRYDGEATRLWERIASATGRALAGTRRSAEFLNWRYADHPSFHYRLFAQYLDERMTGLAAYRVEVAHGASTRIGRLVEYLEDAPDGATRTSALLAYVLEDARSDGVAVMDFFCADRWLTERLAAAGFVGDARETSRVPLLFQPIDRRRTGITFMARLGRGVEVILDWYVTKGDGDQDRPN